MVINKTVMPRWKRLVWMTFGRRVEQRSFDAFNDKKIVGYWFRGVFLVTEVTN